MVISMTQVLLVTGGWGSRSPGTAGYLDETEILQDGQWRNVGKLPRVSSYVKCATLSNTVFVTGNVS